jgi:hypothetical protein
MKGRIIIRPAGSTDLARINAILGVYLYPRFARHSPCFIPWSGVRTVGVRGSSIHVVVEYECPFDFILPGKALPVLEANLEPKKIQRLPSVSAVLDGLARGPVLDYAPSRWLGWLVALAVGVAVAQFGHQLQQPVRRARRGPHRLFPLMPVQRRHED